MTLSFVAFLQAAPNLAPDGNLRPLVPLRPLVVAALLASAGCGASGDRACTDVGCKDQVEIKLKTPTGSWADGVYELDVRADDQLVGTCTLRLPDQLPSVPGSGVRMQCGQGIDFGLTTETQCAMACDGNGCSQRCTPIPGRFEARLSVTGTPRGVDLTLLRDGQLILAEKVEPAYEDSYPNGPECEGHCRQATLERTLP